MNPYESNPHCAVLPRHHLPSGGGPLPDGPNGHQSDLGRKRADHKQRLAALTQRAVALPFSAGSLGLGFLLGAVTNIDLPEDVMCILERTITHAESNRRFQ